MLMLLVVVLVVSGALVAGAAWGIYGKLPTRVEGFLVALAGGALLLSVTSELIEPSIAKSSVFHAMLGVGAGAIVFAVADYLIDEKWGSNSGGGLLAAITLDGIPENLALGVALIGAGGMEVAALAGSILLSNLPEAAGGARAMTADGRSKGTVMLLWIGTAALLALAAIIGNLALAGVGEGTLAVIRCFAAGAVVASLATEVFPQAFREDRHWAGVATALGVILAFSLSSLAGS
ncbi:zinc transporter [Qipengyuania profunda]|jgi:ZIP family zinc transporter|uniref:ZIP family metal transporter n=1 Tax=Qipengyuania profunda TaxID=3113984 RepID=UPI002A18D5DD|nr:zinc transporter [Qipengyuania sp. HL-TH1]WPL57561.1 zinc transporter [Qipengyuania sp. HL-TH5]